MCFDSRWLRSEMGKTTNDAERRKLANKYFTWKIFSHVKKGYKNCKNSPYAITAYYTDRLEKKVNAMHGKLEPAGHKAMCSALASFPVERVVCEAFENAAAWYRASTPRAVGPFGMQGYRI